MISTDIRQAAVAGLFYPDDADELHREVSSLLGAAVADGPAPKALIVPHAGYRYSGAVAASAYARVAKARATVRRVVLLGPAHRVAFAGIAGSGARAFATPLGEIPLDRDTWHAIEDLPQVRIFDGAHTAEHSLEVQLPFLQVALGDFALLPLVVGDATPAQVDAVLARVWGGPETLIVISSDLSHYHDYSTAQRLDRVTSQAIEALRDQDIAYHQACGRNPVNGLLHSARRYGLRAQTIDLRNSGDTAGSRDRVVGYGAYVFEPA
ncbi:MAG: AmmeMemoRadiSam system protein B [Gammaproteobacteria bacterium]